MKVNRVLVLFLIAPKLLAWQHFPARTPYEVCFTPGQDCMRLIISQISGAKQFIDVQAFSFTSKRIARALVAAKKRGIEIRVLLDPSNLDKQNHYSILPTLTHAKIPLFIDDKINRIAHNKVMIIDGKTVITGSFNFTYSAQHFNAENVLIVRDKELASSYLKNWQRRLRSARIYTG